MEGRKLLLIDGNSLMHRAFWAMPNLSTVEGQPTNAILGFLNMFFRLLDLQKPAYIGVCFDKGKTTFRHADFPEYKAGRKPTPDELRSQFPLIREVLSDLGVSCLELESYEADDLIGTLSLRGENQGMDVRIITGDRDALQLISERVIVLLTKKGISELDCMTDSALVEQMGIHPGQIIDYKALAGDSSDNIPGVPGIGEKTALKLLIEHGDLDTLYANIESVTGKVRERLEQNRDKAELSRKLATIDRMVPLELDLEELTLSPIPRQTASTVLVNLQLKSLLNRIDLLNLTEENGEPPEVESNSSCAVELIETAERLQQVSSQLKELPLGVILCSSPGSARKAEIRGVAFATNTTQVYFMACPLDLSMSAIFSSILQQARLVIAHDWKDMILGLHRMCIEVHPTVEDTLLAAYLLQPSQTNYPVDSLIREKTGCNVTSLAPSSKDVWTLSLSELADRAGTLAVHLPLLHAKLREELTLTGMEKLYDEVERPLAIILAQMEETGMCVEREQLQAMSIELGGRMADIEVLIYRSVGHRFNINSTKQLATILFEELMLPARKKTKTGYSTDSEVLEELAGVHPIIEQILAYRQLAKLKSTYLDGMLALLDPQTGRLHTTFNQTVTATGRLSSTEPNLQNIPIRMEEGRRIRSVFQPSEPDMVLLTSDYSQIELRILAHLSGDDGLREAFLTGEDIHTRTASEVLGIPLAEITSAMRRRAKAVNFGIVYGISDFGLAKDIGVSRHEAGQYIASYFARYPRVKAYLDSLVEEAKSLGYVTTILGRRRYLPEIHSSQYTVRQYGERMAMNAPIQGSAADIMKLAMVKLVRDLRGCSFRSRMLLQVHDELVFEVPINELPEYSSVVRRAMEEAFLLSVPLSVDLKIGHTWYDVEEQKSDSNEDGVFR